jgi:hypothetical protein
MALPFICIYGFWVHGSDPCHPELHPPPYPRHDYLHLCLARSEYLPSTSSYPIGPHPYRYLYIWLRHYIYLYPMDTLTLESLDPSCCPTSPHPPRTPGSLPRTRHRPVPGRRPSTRICISSYPTLPHGFACPPYGSCTLPTHQERSDTSREGTYDRWGSEAKQVGGGSGKEREA